MRVCLQITCEAGKCLLSNGITCVTKPDIISVLDSGKCAFAALSLCKAGCTCDQCSCQYMKIADISSTQSESGVACIKCGEKQVFANGGCFCDTLMFFDTQMQKCVNCPVQYFKFCNHSVFTCKDNFVPLYFEKLNIYVCTCSNGFELNEDLGTCSCPTGQYVSQGICVACPIGGFCEGGRLVCYAGVPGGTGCRCRKTEFIQVFRGHFFCHHCPSQAVCDGANIIQCPPATRFDAQRNDCVCDIDKFVTRVGTCDGCPEFAFCDGVEATCRNNIIRAEVQGKLVCSCGFGYYINEKLSCQKCSEHADCALGIQQVCPGFLILEGGFCKCQSQNYYVKDEKCVACDLKRERCDGIYRYCLNNYKLRANGECRNLRAARRIVGIVFAAGVAMGLLVTYVYFLVKG